MWLTTQKAILTKDNMIWRRWKGDPACYFCGMHETVDHLFFQCPVAKFVLGVISMCFHQRDRPNTYEQCWPWVKKALPGGNKMFMFGLAAIC
jgi:hypothetical protein